MGLRYSKELKPELSIELDYVLLIRIAVSVILVIVANTLSFDNLIYQLILLAAILIAGFDIIFSAVYSVSKKNFFDYELLILVATTAAFCAGCKTESALMIIIYRLCKFLLDFLHGHVKKTATDYISPEKTREIEFLKEIISNPEAGMTSAEAKVTPILSLFVKAAVLVGVLYAIILPLISDMTYVMSIRRGLMLIVLSSPLSVITSLPVSSVIGICHSAACGVFMRDGDTLEMTSKLNTVMIDKAGVITKNSPELVSFKSPVFDNETFLKLAAHIAYNSSQRIAAPILRAYKGDIHPEIIDTFKELPGSGMEITVKGLPISLLTKEVLDTRRIEVPELQNMDGTVLYMIVSGRYAGGMQFVEEVNSYAEEAIADIESTSGAKIILLTDDNNTRSMQLADKLAVREYVCECDTYKKYDAVKNTSSMMKSTDVLMYISAEEMDYHTDAEIDAKIGSSADGADMLITGCGRGTLPLSSLSYACSAAKRTRVIQRENIVFAIIVKLVLIALSFLGLATLWFVVLADMVAALLTVINTSRISDVSVFTKLFN